MTTTDEIRAEMRKEMQKIVQIWDTTVECVSAMWCDMRDYLSAVFAFIWTGRWKP
jgi:hypothetical protein